jgi:hypothetical protein
MGKPTDKLASYPDSSEPFTKEWISVITKLFITKVRKWKHRDSRTSRLYYIHSDQWWNTYGLLQRDESSIWDVSQWFKINHSLYSGHFSTLQGKYQVYNLYLGYSRILGSVGFGSLVVSYRHFETTGRSNTQESTVSIATMVARRRPSFMLYVHFLSLFFCDSHFI